MQAALWTADFLLRVAILMIMALGLYYLAVQAFDAWAERPRTNSRHAEVAKIMQQINAGIIRPEDARIRLRTELANGEVIMYSTCRICWKPIVEGSNQLEAWQAYARHFKAQHQ